MADKPTPEEADAELERRKKLAVSPQPTPEQAGAELERRKFGGALINSVTNFPTDEQLRQNPGAQVPKPESFLERAGEVFTGNFRSSSSSLNFDGEGNAIRDVSSLPGFDEITQGEFNNAIASEFGLGNQLLAQISSLASLTQNNKIKGILNL